MISKQTTFKIESVEILDTSMIKLAAFDMPPGETYDPDFLYVKVRAVSAGEYYGDNKNGDWFPEDELKDSYKTFLTAHVFKDHQNKSAASAIGEVLVATWDDDMKCVVLILKIDRKIAPTVTRSIEKGYMTDVSMGCRVPYSICSICGHKAKNPKEYCKHIQFLRRKILPDGKKVYEINIKPKFHDISVVLNGAEKVAKITDIYDSNAAAPKAKITPIQKIAEENEPETGMQKIASHQQFINDAFELPVTDFMQKHAETEKRAEFYKRLSGEILNTSKNEIMQGERGFEPARLLLKAAFTPYWSDMDIEKIALKIKALAAQTGKSKVSVFTGFLTVLDFAGIELSPHEFGALTASVFNCNNPVIEARPGNVITAIKATELESDNDPVSNIGLENALATLKALPSTGITKSIVIRKFTGDPVDGDMQSDIMDRIVSPMIPMRSMHTIPLVKRIRIIARPRETSPIEFGKLNPLFRQLYSMYQGDRVKRALSGATRFGVSKYASYFNTEAPFEKTAKYGKIKALTVGTPVIYGYSKYQRARIDNGEDVSSANRFMAEYPEAVAGLNVMFGPQIYRGIKKKVKSALKSDAADKVKNAAGKFSKHACVAEDLLYLDENGYTDTVDRVLEKMATSRDDIESYLAQRVMDKTASLESAISERADDMLSNKEVTASQDGFVDTMAIAKILAEKL